MKHIKSLLLIGLIATASIAATAQPAQPDFGKIAAMTNAPGPIGMVVNMLPSIDPNATNSFNAKEMTIGANPVWKTMIAAGNTPYLSLNAAYWFKKNLGVYGEVVTLGDGAGHSTIDSFAVLFEARKTYGNIAFYGGAGPARDVHWGRYAGDFLIGAAYRYTTPVEVFSEARYRSTFDKTDDKVNGIIASVGLRLVFK